MIPLLFLLAAFSRVELMDETFEVPANNWWYRDRPVTQEPGYVECVFEADEPDTRIRVVLLSREDLNAWGAGREHEEIGATAAGPRGALRVMVHDPDTYVAIENRGSRPVHVRLRAFLDRPNVRYLSKDRKLVVILISFGVFFAIVTVSARKLLKSISRE